MKVKDIILEANYWKADKTYRQKRLPTLEPDPVDNAEPFDVSIHDQYDDHSPEIDINNAQVRAAITQLLLKLPPRMERILREIFFQGLTLDQASKKYNISRERIRQIEAKALRMLKHPSRAKQLKSMLQTSTQEAANPAQQAAIAINMKKHGKKPKEETDEAKQRLDAKCWTGKHKEGTKMKGGIRVNNCVPNESIDEDYLTLDEQFDMIEEMVEELALQHGVDPEEIWEHFESVDDDELFETAAWQKSSGKNKNGGLNKKGVASYRREHPGSKLQTAVTTKPSKLKPGSKAAKRRKSFCARMGGMKGAMKKPNGKPTRKALALRKWNC